MYKFGIVLLSGKKRLIKKLDDINLWKFHYISTDSLGYPDDGESVVSEISVCPELIAAADRIVSRNKFDGVITTSESHILVAAYLRDRYGIQGLKVTSANAVCNKWTMLQTFGNKLPMAQSWLSGDFLTHPPTHVTSFVLKPIYGSSSCGVLGLSYDHTLAAVKSTATPLKVEAAQNIREEMHCDIVVRDGKLRFLCVSAYNKPVLLGMGTNRASIHLAADDQSLVGVEQFISKLVSNLPFRDSVCHVEIFRLHDGTLMLGEIGARPGGGGIAESIQHIYAVDLWREHFATELGENSTLTPNRSMINDVGKYSGFVRTTIASTGVITHVEPASTLTKIPGVYEAVALASVGQSTIADRRNNFSHRAYFQADSRETVSRILSQIRDTQLVNVRKNEI